MQFTAEALKQAKKYHEDDVVEEIQSLTRMNQSDSSFDFDHVSSTLWVDYNHGFIAKVVDGVITAVNSLYEPHGAEYYENGNILLVGGCDDATMFDGDTLEELCTVNL